MPTAFPTLLFLLAAAMAAALALSIALSIAGAQGRYERVRPAAKPGAGPDARREKVLAVLDGRPGSGKTTICGHVGGAASIVEKDVDFFTQPIVNPRHPAARTPEGRLRASRWAGRRRERAAAGGGEGARAIVEFVRAEIQDWLDAVPAGVRVVFCGISRWGDLDLMPPELGSVPRFLIRLPDEETVKRTALRALESGELGDVPCDTLEGTYGLLKEAIRGNLYAQSRDAHDYALVSGDGGLLIRAILELDPSVPEEAIRGAVSRYASQPTADERIRAYARGRGCDLEP